MPIIPIPQTPQNVPSPSVPALDRERRPTVDASGVIAGMAALGKANQKSLVNPEPFVEAAGAMKSIGDAIAKTGNIVGAVAYRRMLAFDDEQVQNAHADVQVELARQSAFQAQEHDPSKYEPDAAKGWQELQKKYGSIKGVTADGRKRLDLLLSTNIKRGMYDVQAAAANKQNANTASAYDANITQALHDRQYAEAQRLAGEAGGVGYFSPEKTKVIQLHAQDQKREDDLNDMIASDPRKAVQLFSSPGAALEKEFGADKVNAFLKKAQSEADYQEQRALDQINEAMATARKAGEPFTAKDVEPWMHGLSDLSLERVAAALDKQAVAARSNDPVQLSQLLTKIASLDPTGTEGKIRLIELRKEIDDGAVGPSHDVLMKELTDHLADAKDGLSAKGQEVANALKEVDAYGEAGAFGVWRIPFDGDNIRWSFSDGNTKSEGAGKGWHRKNFPWEPKGWTPIQISQEDAAKLTSKTIKAGEFVTDLSAEQGAAKIMDGIKGGLRQRVISGELKNEIEVRDAAREVLKKPAEDAAARKLKTARDAGTLDGMGVGPNPTQPANAILDELWRNYNAR